MRPPCHINPDGRRRLRRAAFTAGHLTWKVLSIFYGPTDPVAIAVGQRHTAAWLMNKLGIRMPKPPFSNRQKAMLYAMIAALLTGTVFLAYSGTTQIAAYIGIQNPMAIAGIAITLVTASVIMVIYKQSRRPKSASANPAYKHSAQNVAIHAGLAIALLAATALLTARQRRNRSRTTKE